jgi:hypothetical protein
MIISTKKETWARRAYSRVKTNVPAVLWHPKYDRYADVIIRNMSKDGMCFACIETATKDDRIDIFIGENVFSPEMLEDARQYEVQIKWVDKNLTNIPCQAGAQIMIKSEAIYKDHARELLGICDLCGTSKFQKQICEGNKNINLCNFCYTFYTKMPEGLRKYLVGNIY